MRDLLRDGRWQPWPQPWPPELDLLAQNRPEEPVCALLGSGGDGRDRFGLAGIPSRVQRLEPGPGIIARAVDDRPTDAIRVIALGYEMGAPEAYLTPDAPPRGQPAGLVLDFESAWVVDHATRRLAPFGRHAPEIAERGIGRPEPPLADARPRLPPPARGNAGIHADLIPSVSDAEHERRIRRTLAHIRAGDIYQANIARRLRVESDRALDPIACLAALYQRNPVAHAAYLRAGGIELLSNSMETLLHFAPHTRCAESYPIKGTHGRDPGERHDGGRLIADAKERAEHVMIVDLARNDLGRVCVPGSVTVPELMGTYGYRGVWHGVSTVRGTLAADRSAGELTAALFPGGSITGAPKRRAMEIIHDLEDEPRGFYTGTIAWIMPDGRLSASILIRTMVRDNRGWSLSVGGGIVADSQPERELCETWEKVEVFRQLLAGDAAAIGRGAA